MAKKHSEDGASVMTGMENQPETKVRVNCERLNLRKGPSPTADVLYILNRSETLHLLEDRGEWLKIHYPKQNLTGYVMSHLVDVEV